jgi:hypothetical protein
MIVARILPPKRGHVPAKLARDPLWTFPSGSFPPTNSSAETVVDFRAVNAKGDTRCRPSLRPRSATVHPHAHALIRMTPPSTRQFSHAGPSSDARRPHLYQARAEQDACRHRHQQTAQPPREQDAPGNCTMGAIRSILSFACEPAWPRCPRCRAARCRARQS